MSKYDEKVFSDLKWVKLSKDTANNGELVYGKDFPSRMGRKSCVVIIISENESVACFVAPKTEKLEIMNVEEARIIFANGIPKDKNSDIIRGDFFDIKLNKEIKYYGILRYLFMPDTVKTIIKEVGVISSKLK